MRERKKKRINKKSIHYWFCCPPRCFCFLVDSWILLILLPLTASQDGCCNWCINARARIFFSWVEMLCFSFRVDGYMVKLVCDKETIASALTPCLLYYIPRWNGEIATAYEMETTIPKMTNSLWTNCFRRSRQLNVIPSRSLRLARAIECIYSKLVSHHLACDVML